MKKRFDRSLFNQYDQLAKNAGIRFLTQLWGAIEVRPHQDRYGPDLVYRLPNGVEGTLECEVKLTWSGGEFPYNEINVLGRKTKYFVNGTDFFLLAKDGASFLYIHHDVILQSPLVEVPNKYVYKGESFYKVPTQAATFGELLGVDNAPPLCNKCKTWVGYGKLEMGTWMCLGCGHEQL